MTGTAQQIGDELYTLSPQAFTAARDEQIAAAKNAGNRELASELAAFKRPGLAAGLVNLVALTRPDAVAELIELGQTIREAQGNVTPVQLRDLSAQRRRTLDAIVALAESLATERGDAPPSRAQLTEVESTFAAAMADDRSARAVSAGRVVKPLSYSGFGEAAGGVSAEASGWDVFASGAPSGKKATAPASGTAPSGRASSGGAPSRTGSAGATASRTGKSDAAKATAEAARVAEAERAAEEATQRRAAAHERVDQARAQLDATASTEAAADEQVRGLSDEIATLRTRLEEAHREARHARQARLTAERDLASAERRLRRAE
jgi:hypothetical protein